MIALVNPPNPPGRVSNKDMMGGFGQCYPAECDVKVPPIDVPYIASVLRDSKVEFKVIDCLGSNLSLEELLQRLNGIQLDFVFIRTSTPTFLWDSEVSRKLKEVIKAKIVFFGPHVNVAKDDVISNPNIDAIILGEPEYAVRDIAIQGFLDTPGIWYKEGGKTIKNDQRDYIEDLDALPFPAWDMLPYMEYTIGTLMPDVRPTLFLQTSRGCPFSCRYCPYPVAQGDRYRKRSAKNVIDEITYMVRNFNVKNIVVRDAEFTLDKQRVEDICEGLLTAGHNISWRCETRVDTLDDSLLDLMHKAGCTGINMGIESRSEKVCKSVGRRPLDVNDTKKIVKKCKELGIHTFCFFIIGLPGDDVVTFLDTLNYAIDLKADISQFTVATPYLGTGMYEWAFNNNYIETFDINKITGFEVMMRNENLSSEQIMLMRSHAQRLMDLIRSGSLMGAGEILGEDRSPISFLMKYYFQKFYLKGIRRIVIYGTRGLSIPQIKKIGFEVIAVVDAKHEGKIIDGMTVLNLECIKFIKPEAILLSPYKSSISFKNIVDNETIIVEVFSGLKRIIIRMLSERRKKGLP